MKQFIATALIALTAQAWAQGSAGVAIQEAWVRATVVQQQATGAFMRLTAQADTRLVEVRSPLAGVAEIHEMSMDNNVMKMHQVAGVALAAGQTVELRPGGYHVMLLDLKGQAKAGEVVPLTLVFEGQDGQRQSVDVQAAVRPLGAAMPAAGRMPDAAGHKRQ